MPWGTGVSNVKGMLTEVHRQKLAAIFYVEYEYNWGKSLPEIAQSVAYFDHVAVELAAWDQNQREVTPPRTKTETRLEGGFKGKIRGD